jgi:hypothetical protein
MNQVRIIVNLNQFQQTLKYSSKKCEDKGILKNHIHLQDLKKD